MMLEIKVSTVCSLHPVIQSLVLVFLLFKAISIYYWAIHGVAVVAVESVDSIH
jgi:hypothetical protein